MASIDYGETILSSLRFPSVRSWPIREAQVTTAQSQLLRKLTFKLDESATIYDPFVACFVS